MLPPSSHRSLKRLSPIEHLSTRKPLRLYATIHILSSRPKQHATLRRRGSSLRSLIQQSHQKSFGNVGENAPWALTLVASFSVLLGPSLFLHCGPLKLVMNIAQKALRHRPGRDLNPHVWRTFIWSMTQLYMQQGPTAEWMTISSSAAFLCLSKQCMAALVRL
jgi:hypothetical protein